ncbi:hypothetical protein CP8484711_1122, partial [Chlamydia psittaci 84-8471/1]
MYSLSPINPESRKTKA